MKKKIFLIILILAVAAGGFFYWRLNKLDEESDEVSQPPTLFSKEDYKIEEREDGKFIVVEKVGLTCKVPEGWRVEKVEGSNYPARGAWIELFSPDAEIFDILTKGCGINITSWISEEDSGNIENKIKIIKESNSKLIEGPDQYKYEYEISTLSNHIALKGKPSETNNKFNKFIKGESLDIIIENDRILSLDTSFPPLFESKCIPTWKEFLENVAIK